jgi:dihydrofolate reductase
LNTSAPCGLIVLLLLWQIAVTVLDGNTVTMQRPEIITIAALTIPDRVIGCQGKLPWSIPDDLQRFKRLTWGHAVVLGRKTWEFDLAKRSLPGRQIIVLSRTAVDFVNPQLTQTGVNFASSWEDALLQAASYSKLFIAGGASVYAQTLTQSDALELTLVTQPYPGDTFFPAYDSIVEQHFEKAQHINRDGYQFVTYRRLKSEV